MFILLLPLCFILLLCNWEIKPQKGFKEILLKSTLLFAIIILLITELLSLFHLLNPTSIVISWSLIALGLSARIYQSKTLTFSSLKTFGKKIKSLSSMRGRFIVIGLISVILAYLKVGIAYGFPGFIYTFLGALCYLNVVVFRKKHPNSFKNY